MKLSLRDQLVRLCLCLGTLFALTNVSPAQLPPSVPEGVEVIEHLNDQIPLDLSFTDEHGKQIFLGKLFNQGKPVILSLNYSDCPMLCSLQLTGLVNGLKEIEGWTAGDQFHVVSVSINPAETHVKAKDTEAKYLNAYGKPKAAGGWSFLTGKQEPITKLANTVGFKYRYVPDTKEYAHPAVLMICSPEGKITRYLYGVQYPGQTLKLSLLEASEGKVGTTTERIIMSCYRYNPATGTYAMAATRVMAFGAICVVGMLSLLLVPVWYRSIRSGRKSSSGEKPESSGSDQHLAPHTS